VTQQLRIRPPALAGSFYPAPRDELAAMIRYCFDGVPVTDLPAPKAIVAPHAGYVFSGPVAARAYARLVPAKDRIRRVVLLCPNHRVALRGMALPAATLFRTPLGDVPLDAAGVAAITRLPGVGVLDAAHAEEHAIEVHLPFLQTVLGDFSLVPLVVGETATAQVRAVLEALWGGPETLILISSDLSHYLAYDAARRRDADTAAAIETFALARLDHGSACGRFPLAGFLDLARDRGLVPVRLDLRNSGDTAGPDDRVVGYGAWAFCAGDQPQLGARQRAALLTVARHAVAQGLASGEIQAPALAALPPELSTWRAAFVTLERHGELRGCIGSLQATRALALDVAGNAWNAAFADPRFPPLTAAEREGLTLSISVLSPPRPLKVADEADLLRRLRPGVDGLILGDGPRRATFLPAVWDDLPAPHDFVRQLKRKAGLPADYWSAGMTADIYGGESFGGAYADSN
jgi:AmmeMemoRadiSam system protein B/AmmeMemoRadiSam system protein A